ncbi:MAG: DUF3501 family protein [Actinomycetota bacterium]|nr:DUF3501 family protein [Actinomycetota bacterium]
MKSLTLSDIEDIRAYERHRDDYRREVIALKKVRRVAVGPILTLLFENRETIRFQIQEMARAEKLFSDEAIEVELGIYNPLIPSKNQLSATLFLELTSKDQLVEWLPKLVGIEDSLELKINGLAEGIVAFCEESHKEQLTRNEMTASVHYIRFDLNDEQAEALKANGGSIRSTHFRYDYEAELTFDTIGSLAKDWI